MRWSLRMGPRSTPSCEARCRTYRWSRRPGWPSGPGDAGKTPSADHARWAGCSRTGGVCSDIWGRSACRCWSAAGPARGSSAATTLWPIRTPVGCSAPCNWPSRSLPWQTRRPRCWRPLRTRRPPPCSAATAAYRSPGRASSGEPRRPGGRLLAPAWAVAAGFCVVSRTTRLLQAYWVFSIGWPAAACAAESSHRHGIEPPGRGPATGPLSHPPNTSPGGTLAIRAANWPPP